MTPDTSGAGRSVPKKSRARHRAPRTHRPILVRAIGVGGAAACIGLLAEMNAPDAEALSILLPAGGNNATQINILEGNVFDPQFGVGGNGSNTSHNSTIGALMFGLGNGQKEGTSGGSLFGPITLGGATGNGNVTQINILSYNIINPQWSIAGGNLSDNTTVSNVAVNNGNNSQTTAASSGSTASFLGGAIGNGNTTQLSFFSGNIFNPQFSLFGTNQSNNTAITNVAADNGDGSTTSVTSGGALGMGLFGMTGNGNTNQLAVVTSNIFNPQFSLLGGNLSNNNANANQATGNGNSGDNGVGITGTGLGNIFAVGNTGNGNTTQNASGSGNIYNDQFNFGLGNILPSPQTPAPAAPAPPTASNASDSEKPLTNQQVTGGGQSGLTNQQLLELQNLAPGSSSQTGTVLGPRPLQTVVKKIKDAVDGITKPQKPAAAESPEGHTNSGTP